jgi:hypothetical protein
MAVKARAPCGDCNNSIQFFIINVPSQQLQRQLQTQNSVHIGNNNNNNNKVILIVILIKITTDFIFMTVFPEIF